MKLQIDIDFMNQLFDYKDGDLFWKVDRRSRKVKGQKVGSLLNGYRAVRINKKTYLNHRIIFAMHHGYCPECIDHIDRNPLNNKIENLRVATFSQNIVNSTVHINNKCGSKNVYFNKQKNKWRAQVKFDGKTYAKDFIKIEDAIIHASFLRNKHHGEFANG